MGVAHLQILNIKGIIGMDYFFSILTVMTHTITAAWKVSKYGVISGPNAGKYGPEITPYLDAFLGKY